MRYALGEVYKKLTYDYQGGVTYFKVIMEAIVTTTEESVQNMQEMLKIDSLKDIKGEKVGVLVS